jgi:transmembrane sensor
MEKNEIKYLAEKISDGTATPQEVALYNYHYNQFQNGESVEGNQSAQQDEIGIELQSRIHQHINSESLVNRKKVFSFLKVAASVAVVMIAAFLYLKNAKNEQNTIANLDKRLGEDINPGSNKAILTLSDGSELSLDESNTGTLANQGDVEIKKLANGQIVYSDNGSEKSPDIYNTISVPKGGKYQLTLPDGTKVWLNALSKLKFPVCFNKNQRLVELEGEAYFEVAKSYRKDNPDKRKTFIVKTASQNIEVLGTHFNVNAYKDEAQVKTTLLEGSVKVYSPKNGSSKILKPLQQASLSSDGFTVSNEIDVEEIMAWKNELFYFNNTDLQTIMRQLARWYDVDIAIDKSTDKKFNGVLSRNVKLSTVLKMMETTSNLKFKVDERRITMLQ